MKTAATGNSVLSAAVGAAMAAFAAPAVMAQGGAQPLEQITVTAQRREQSLQDVSVSVTAISGTALLEGDITDLRQLDVLAPGLQVGFSGGDPRPAMRGARTEQVEAADVAVAFYTDGVYRPRHGQGLASFIDVERVEVLRGPQGTLFGRNALGGLIQVITKKPHFDETEFGFSVTGGNYSRLRGEGFVNVPLTETAALRFSASREKRDPYMENFGDGGGLNDRDDYYVRGQLLLQPSDAFDVLLRGELWREDANGHADFGAKVLGVPVNPATNQTDGVNGVMQPRIGRSSDCTTACGRPGAGLDDTALPTIDDLYRINRDFDPVRNVRDLSLSLEANYRTAFADFKATFAFSDYDELRLADADHTPFPSIVAGNAITSEMTTQELQISSVHDGPFEWVAGLYFFQEDLTNAFLWQDVSTLENNVPVERIDQWAPWLQQLRLDTRSWAAYGQATYSITDDFRVLGGLRYTDDDRDWDIFGQNPNDLSRVEFTQPTLLGASNSWSRFTWKAGAEYDFAEQSMGYATVSTGFLAGNALGAFNGDASSDEQRVTAYEVGVKNTLLDGRLILNVAAYYNDFTELLATRFVEVEDTVISVQDNAGEITALGLEIEADWRPTDELSLGARVSLQDAEYGTFITQNPFAAGGETINGVSNVFNLDGNQVQQQPDFTATLLGSYDFQLADGSLIRPGVTFHYSSSYRTNDSPFFFARQGSFTRTDARVSWLSRERDWRVTAAVRNIEDKAVQTRSVVFGGNVAMADFAPPRTWSVNVSYNY